MHREMLGRRLGQEEMRVVALRLIARRDPVREISQPTRGQDQAIRFEHRAEADPPCRQSRTMRALHAQQRRRVDQSTGVAGTGEQHAAFLKRFPNRGEPERHRLGVEPMRDSRAKREVRGQGGIAVLDPSAGKHQRTGGEIDGVMTHHHERFQPVGPVAQQHDRRRRPGRRFLRHVSCSL